MNEFCEENIVKDVDYVGTVSYDGIIALEEVVKNIINQHNKHRIPPTHKQVRKLLKYKCMELENSPDFIIFKDANGRWLEANGTVVRSLGLENFCYKGKNDLEIAEYANFYRDVLQYCFETDEMAWQNGTMIQNIEMIPRQDGTVRVLNVMKFPIFLPNGARGGLIVMGVATDQ